MLLTSLVEKSLELVWPAACAACDRPVPDELLFCGPCQLSVSPLSGVCPGCALPRTDGPREIVFEGKRCARCLRVPFPFLSARAGFEYGEAVEYSGACVPSSELGCDDGIAEPGW